MDAPGPGVESAPVNNGGVDRALARLLGPTAAAQVDKSALDYLLERRGYKPRRRSANYERPPSERNGLAGDDDDDIGVDSDSGARFTRVVVDDEQDGHGSHRFDVYRPRGAEWCRGCRGCPSGGCRRGTDRDPGSNVSAWRRPRGGQRHRRVGGVRVGSRRTRSRPRRIKRDVPARGEGQFGGVLVPAGRQARRARRRRRRGRHRSSRGPALRQEGARSSSSSSSVHVAGPHSGLIRSFVAGPGCAVGGFLLLTGQKAAMTIERVRVAPSPRRCRTAPSPGSPARTPHVYANVAVGLARRLRPALPARLWDRCGAEWCALKAGECLTSSRTGMSHAGRHPEGVYVVATGCVRLGGWFWRERKRGCRVCWGTGRPPLTYWRPLRPRGCIRNAFAGERRRRRRRRNGGEAPRSRRGGGRGHRTPRGGRASRG